MFLGHSRTTVIHFIASIRNEKYLDTDGAAGPPAVFVRESGGAPRDRAAFLQPPNCRCGVKLVCVGGCSSTRVTTSCSTSELGAGTVGRARSTITAMSVLQIPDEDTQHQAMSGSGVQGGLSVTVLGFDFSFIG